MKAKAAQKETKPHKQKVRKLKEIKGDVMAGKQVTITDILQNRVNMYSFISRLFIKEVDQEFLDKLNSMKFPKNTQNANVDAGYELIRTFLNTADVNVLNVLAVDYVHAFIGSGVSGYSAAYPYESVYTSPKRLMMQEARDEMLALYKAAGLAKKDSWKEGEDHIALELEYMAILAQRSVDEYEKGDEDAAITLLVQQRNFLEDHLFAWYPMMEADIQKFAKTNFYKGTGKLALGFLECDKELLDDILSDVDFEDESAAARQKAKEEADAKAKEQEQEKESKAKEAEESSEDAEESEAQNDAK